MIKSLKEAEILSEGFNQNEFNVLSTRRKMTLCFGEVLCFLLELQHHEEGVDLSCVGSPLVWPAMRSLRMLFNFRWSDITGK
jgi:hypothetical protein